MGVIVGIDEVGRGSWAGPLVAAAVIINQPIRGLQDSKQISKTKREVLAKIIHNQAYSIGLGWVTASKIDELGLTQAIRLAMQQALEAITPAYDEIIIDGNVNFLADNPLVKTLVRADALVPAVSAASIVAKVARDDFMQSMATRYPEYEFAHHVGYGTKLHHDRLLSHGPCELHRRSFKPVKLAMGIT